MYTRNENLKALEKKYGTPVECEMEYEIHSWEYDVVKGSQHSGRAHDVTMFIRKRDDKDKFALIRKHFFPEGALRAPSGAAVEGESLEAGAIREAYEETGLDVELIRYLARINVIFTSGGRKIEWISHVFEARQTGGELCPIDTEEIEEARWESMSDLQGCIRDILMNAEWELFRYRVALTDLAVEKMEENDA